MASPEFSNFIQQTLSIALPPEQVVVLLTPECLNSHFLKAFTHKTYTHDNLTTNDLSSDSDDANGLQNYNYEILEKLGDRTMNASFQMWMYEVIGQETNALQPYSDIDKRYTGTDYLNILADNLNFTNHVFINDGTVTKKIKEDVFEAFVAALVLAGDEYIARAYNTPDIGVVIAKRWVYAVLNRYLRPKIEVSDVFQYVDKRSRVNEIWQFNKWTNGAKYITNDPNQAKQTGKERGKQPQTKEKKTPKPTPVANSGVIIVTLKSPNAPNLPDTWRNIDLGVGQGETVALAKEAAANQALILLQNNFIELNKFNKDLELRYEYLSLGRLRRLLTTPVMKGGIVIKGGPALYSKLIAVMLGKHQYVDERGNSIHVENVIARSIRIKGIFSLQLRVKIDGSWKNEFRGHGINDAEAAADATQQLLQALDSK